MSAANKDNAKRRDARFYTCIILGFIFVMCGFFAPPIGEVSNNVLVGAGMFLCVGSLAVGIDIKGCIRELRLLKNETLKTK